MRTRAGMSPEAWVRRTHREGIIVWTSFGLVAAAVILTMAFGLTNLIQRDNHGNSACSAHGWEVADLRGPTTLCIDNHGYARTP